MNTCAPLRSLLITLLLILPSVGFSQSWNIKLGGGYTYMTLPKESPYFTGQYFQRPYNYDGDSVSTRSPSLALQLCISRRWNEKPFSVGLRLALADLKRHNYGIYAAPNQYAELYVGRPTISVQPFVSYYYKAFYGGIMLGVLGYFGKGPMGTNRHRQTGTGFVGFAGGANLGYELTVTRRIQAFAELSCNYIRAKQAYDAYKEKVRFFQPMITIGIGYKFQ